MRRLLLLCYLVTAGVVGIFAQGENRLKDNFDFDWKFSLNDDRQYADPVYNDQSWEDIQLPHDWSIKLNFDHSISGRQLICLVASVGIAKRLLYRLPIKISPYLFYLMAFFIRVMFILTVNI